MTRYARALAGLLLACCLLLVPAWAWAEASLGLDVSGRILGPRGGPVVGALLSDGVDAVLSGKDGRFSLASAPGRVLALAAPAGYRAPQTWWWPVDQAARRPLIIRLKSAPPPQGPLRLALLSDPHLFDPTAPPARFTPPADKLDVPLATWKRAAARLRSLAPDLTLVTGDLCADGDKGPPEHLQAQLALAARALDMLPRPYRALPGNHDVRYHKGRVILAPWRRRLGPARQVFFLPGAAVIMLDNLAISTSQGKPRNCGALPEEALAWLKNVLELIPPQTPLILASHFPLASPLAGANPLLYQPLVQSLTGPGPALRNTDQQAQKILGLIRDRPILALLNGHEHAFQESYLHARRQTLHLVGIPAFCGGWWRGDRTWGALKFPPGYLLLSYDGAISINTPLRIRFYETQP